MFRRNFLSGIVASIATSFGFGAATGTTNPKLTNQKLRIWTIGSPGNPPTMNQIKALQRILENWDEKSTLDIIWGPDLYVQQFDIGEKDINAIVKQPPIEVGKVVTDENGELCCTVLLREPMVRIIQNQENGGANASQFAD